MSHYSKVVYSTSIWFDLLWICCTTTSINNPRQNEPLEFEHYSHVTHVFQPLHTRRSSSKVMHCLLPAAAAAAPIRWIHRRTQHASLPVSRVYIGYIQNPQKGFNFYKARSAERGELLLGRSGPLPVKQKSGKRRKFPILRLYRFIPGRLRRFIHLRCSGWPHFPMRK